MAESSLYIALNLPEQCETLLRQALTHKHDDVAELDCNERLEFLGDAVVGMIVTEYLYTHHPKAREGLLSRARAAVVSRPSLAAVAHSIGLHNLILTSTMEKKHGITQGLRVLADAMEAVIAAVYLTLGYEPTKEFILKHFGDMMSKAIDSAVSLDHKTELQEYVHRTRSVTPTYELLSAYGPDHNRCFTFQAYAGDVPLSIGTGNSKKAAQQDAAYGSLMMLKRIDSELKKDKKSMQPDTIKSDRDFETTEEYVQIAAMFNLPEPIVIEDLACKGNINTESFLVKAGGRRYILQKVSPKVFPLPHRVMRNLIALCDHHSQQTDKLPASWQCMKLVPTRKGAPYLQIVNGDSHSIYRMLEFIEGTCSYKQLSDVSNKQRAIQIAEEAGRGLATFNELTQELPLDNFYPSLPGYRDTKLYFDQLDSVWNRSVTEDDAAKYLPEEPYLRDNVKPQYVLHFTPEQTEAGLYDQRKDQDAVKTAYDFFNSHRATAMKLWQEVHDGILKQSIIHGDPKLENFLFSPSSDKVVSMIDLDTLMPYTWLADWGDMARSLINPLGEKIIDASTIYIDIEVFKALMQGYVKNAHSIPRYEIELMTVAPAIIAMELGLRFFTDYLRGDNYFGLTEEDKLNGVTNLTRAQVQIRVAELILEAQDELSQALQENLESSSGLSVPV